MSKTLKAHQNDICGPGNNKISMSLPDGVAHPSATDADGFQIPRDVNGDLQIAGSTVENGLALTGTDKASILFTESMVTGELAFVLAIGGHIATPTSMTATFTNGDVIQLTKSVTGNTYSFYHDTTASTGITSQWGVLSRNSFTLTIQMKWYPPATQGSTIASEQTGSGVFECSYTDVKITTNGSKYKAIPTNVKVTSGSGGNTDTIDTLKSVAIAVRTTAVGVPDATVKAQSNGDVAWSFKYINGGAYRKAVNKGKSTAEGSGGDSVRLKVIEVSGVHKYQPADVVDDDYTVVWNEDDYGWKKIQLHMGTESNPTVQEMYMYRSIAYKGQSPTKTAVFYGAVDTSLQYAFGSVTSALLDTAAERPSLLATSAVSLDPIKVVSWMNAKGNGITPPAGYTPITVSGTNYSFAAKVASTTTAGSKIEFTDNITIGTNGTKLTFTEESGYGNYTNAQQVGMTWDASPSWWGYAEVRVYTIDLSGVVMINTIYAYRHAYDDPGVKYSATPLTAAAIAILVDPAPQTLSPLKITTSGSTATVTLDNSEVSGSDYNVKWTYVHGGKYNHQQNKFDTTPTWDSVESTTEVKNSTNPNAGDILQVRDLKNTGDLTGWFKFEVSVSSVTDPSKAPVTAPLWVSISHNGNVGLSVTQPSPSTLRHLHKFSDLNIVGTIVTANVNAQPIRSLAVGLRGTIGGHGVVDFAYVDWSEEHANGVKNLSVTPRSNQPPGGPLGTDPSKATFINVPHDDTASAGAHPHGYGIATIARGYWGMAVVTATVEKKIHDPTADDHDLVSYITAIYRRWSDAADDVLSKFGYTGASYPAEQFSRSIVGRIETHTEADWAPYITETANREEGITYKLPGNSGNWYSWSLPGIVGYPDGQAHYLADVSTHSTTEEEWERIEALVADDSEFYGAVTATTLPAGGSATNLTAPEFNIKPSQSAEAGLYGLVIFQADYQRSETYDPNTLHEDASQPWVTGYTRYLAVYRSAFPPYVSSWPSSGDSIDNAKARLGLFLDGVDTNGQSRHRRREYEATLALMGDTMKDEVTSFTLELRADKGTHRIGTFYPWRKAISPAGRMYLDSAGRWGVRTHDLNLNTPSDGDPWGCTLPSYSPSPVAVGVVYKVNSNNTIDVEVVPTMAYTGSDTTYLKPHGHFKLELFFYEPPYVSEDEQSHNEIWYVGITEGNHAWWSDVPFSADVKTYFESNGAAGTHPGNYRATGCRVVVAGGLTADASI